MKKLVIVLLLAFMTLTLFVSCHDCAVCGKSKLLTTKKTVLGKDVYICNDCKNIPQDVKNGVKDGFNEVKDGVKSIFNK